MQPQGAERQEGACQCRRVPMKVLLVALETRKAESRECVVAS